MGSRTLIRFAAVLAIAAVASVIRAEDPAERAKSALDAAKLQPVAMVALSKACPEKARAEAALALAKTKMVSTDGPGCGLCRTDLENVRALALKGGKPIVLFVGGCDGRSREFAEDGAFMVRAKEYAGDEKGATKRIIVIGRKGTAGPLQWESFPADATTETVRRAIKGATAEAAKPPPVAEPTAAASPYRTYVIGAGGTVCTGPNCPLRK